MALSSMARRCALGVLLLATLAMVMMCATPTTATAVSMSADSQLELDDQLDLGLWDDDDATDGEAFLEQESDEDQDESAFVDIDAHSESRAEADEDEEVFAEFDAHSDDAIDTEMEADSEDRSASEEDAENEAEVDSERSSRRRRATPSAKVPAAPKRQQRAKSAGGVKAARSTGSSASGADAIIAAEKKSLADARRAGQEHRASLRAARQAKKAKKNGPKPAIKNGQKVKATDNKKQKKSANNADKKQKSDKKQQKAADKKKQQAAADKKAWQLADARRVARAKDPKLRAKHARRQEKFAAFQKASGKVYKTKRERRMRYAIFKSNMKKAEQMNAQHGPNGAQAGKHGQKVFSHLAKFADRTPAEFKRLLGSKPSKATAAQAVPLPAGWDSPIEPNLPLDQFYGKTTGGPEVSLLKKNLPPIANATAIYQPEKVDPADTDALSSVTVTVDPNADPAAAAAPTSLVEMARRTNKRQQQRSRRQRDEDDDDDEVVHEYPVESTGDATSDEVAVEAVNQYEAENRAEAEKAALRQATADAAAAAAVAAKATADTVAAQKAKAEKAAAAAVEKLAADQEAERVRVAKAAADAQAAANTDAEAAKLKAAADQAAAEKAAADKAALDKATAEAARKAAAAAKAAADAKAAAEKAAAEKATAAAAAAAKAAADAKVIADKKAATDAAIAAATAAAAAASAKVVPSSVVSLSKVDPVANPAKQPATAPVVAPAGPPSQPGVSPANQGGMIDWRNYNVLTPVKEQGECGSCYAQSAIASLESAVARKTGKLESLSVQQVVSCGNIGGCGGSSPDKVFGYLAKTGVVTEAAYPYNDQAKKQNKESTCAITGVKQNLVAGFSYVTPVCYDEKSCNNQNEEDLVKALAWGPISVIIDANPLQLYVGGVMTSTSGCLNNFEAVNHAVQLVGYGSDGVQKYWILRNSWGADWGEKGYFRIAAGGNQCGVATFAVAVQLK